MPRAPLLLAIESATPFASVALLRGERLLAEVTTTGRQPHSERLLPAIDRLMALAELGLEAVDGFALSIGPGSFTGLRIGLATLKGLAFPDERLVAPVPTLAAVSLGAAGAPHPVVCALDARRGEFYAAVFGAGTPERKPLLPEGVFRPEELAARIPRPCTLVGVAGEEEVLATLHTALGSEVVLTPPQPPRAFHVGWIGGRLLARGGGVAVDRVAPCYLRRAEAEARRTGEPLEPPPVAF
jgi:tRNA threonylcarbamoyladenosine biosynthesis protein TsaB